MRKCRSLPRSGESIRIANALDLTSEQARVTETQKRAEHACVRERSREEKGGARKRAEIGGSAKRVSRLEQSGLCDDEGKRALTLN